MSVFVALFIFVVLSAMDFESSGLFPAHVAPEHVRHGGKRKREKNALPRSVYLMSPNGYVVGAILISVAYELAWPTKYFSI